MLELPSEAAVGLFHQTNSCLPQEPGKYASRLLDVFFSEEKLARSCCTKAAGRELLDQTVLEGIKCKLYVQSLLIHFITVHSIDRSNQLQVSSNR